MVEACWDSGLKVTKNMKCPMIEEAETAKIIVPYDLWISVLRLTDEVATEWLGYLQAEQLETGDWYVTKIEVPEQEVTSSSVTPKDTIDAPGVIHSHVFMGVTFSGTDDEYLNKNHEFSIVVNKRHEVYAVQRVKLPCGTMTVVETSVEVEHPEPEKQDAFIENAKKKLTEKTYCCSPPQYQAWRWGQQLAD